MYRQNQALVELLAPVVATLGYEMLGLEQLNAGRKPVLRVYIDCVRGISLSDCQRVSEQVDGVLDVHAPISGEYVLEVSSPGLDRPLFSLEQMARFIGHRVKLQTRYLVEGRRRFTGIIEKVEENQVQIEIEGQVYAITADAIERARLSGLS